MVDYMIQFRVIKLFVVNTGNEKMEARVFGSHRNRLLFNYGNDKRIQVYSDISGINYLELLSFSDVAKIHPKEIIFDRDLDVSVYNHVPTKREPNTCFFSMKKDQPLHQRRLTDGVGDVVSLARFEMRIHDIFPGEKIGITIISDVK